MQAHVYRESAEYPTSSKYGVPWTSIIDTDASVQPKPKSPRQNQWQEGSLKWPVGVGQITTLDSISNQMVNEALQSYISGEKMLQEKRKKTSLKLKQVTMTLEMGWEWDEGNVIARKKMLLGIFNPWLGRSEEESIFLH